MNFPKKYTNGAWDLKSAVYSKQKSGTSNMGLQLGIFTNKTDIIRALKEHMDPTEVIKLIFADPHYKDALTAQMTNDPKELTKFVALDLLVSLVIYNQNAKRDKELYLRLKPLINSIFTVEELYDKKQLIDYGRENDLFFDDEYVPTPEEIRAAIPKEYLQQYVRENMVMSDLFTPDTIERLIEDMYLEPTDGHDTSETKCGDVMLQDPSFN